MKRTLFVFLFFLFLFEPQIVFSQTMADYTAIPPFVGQSAPPLVMMVMGRDHKLYYEAYNDASDLDGDGQLDVGYNHSLDYYGYFDPYKCYDYTTSGADRFVPVSVTSDKYCSGGYWSGNFLNWLATSRIDALRKVLYGGYRSRDDSSTTYLEASYIPQDAHSWGKEYNGSDTSQLTPFSNPQSGKRHLFCITSKSDGAAPVIRVALNDSHRIWEWASTERAVCSGPGTSSSFRRGPVGTRSDIQDYTIRVEVCNENIGLEENCRAYPNSPPYKPVGLFQRFGEGTEKVCSKTFLSCSTDADCGTTSDDVCIDKGQMYFGLITGTYTKNLSGGVLRWNIDAITHDVDNSNVGIIKNQGMLKTLNNLKTKGFDYSNFAYGPWAWGGSQNCGWLTSRGLQEGECRMWGNPVAEMMYEAERYFAGKSSPTSAFSSGTDASGTDDNALGLTNESSNWIAPYNKYPICSKPFMIVLSDINPSYDSDQLPGVDSNFGSFSGDLAGLDVSSLADTIGSQEGINNTNRFIGQSGSNFDSICTSKSVSSLGSIRGLCPEEPTKKGSYYSASVAYYGKELFSTNNNNLPDITTYSVALSSPVPEINIDVGSNTVKLVPIGKSVSGCVGVNTYCAQRATLSYDVNANGLTISNLQSNGYCPSNQIVDFYVDTIGTGSGTFRINFEDVEQGADHDMDAIVEYNYCVGSSCSPAIGSNQVKISLDSSLYAAGCIDQVLGFVISGTTADGVYLPVKDDDVSNSQDGDTPAVVANMPKTWSKTFTVSSGGSSASFLKDPLWYAAKWGGFEDQNGNNLPDLQAEWDNDGDGVPDTYFLVTNPLEMEQQLTAVFASILRKTASGTSVSILATSAEGEGALYQAYFNPEKIMTDGSTREWLGYMRGLFLDSYGNLREDTNNDGRLVFKDDKILRLRLDTQTNNVMADLYSDSDEDGSPDSSTPDSTVSIDSINPIWEGGKKVALSTKSTRRIYTWVDSDSDGVVDNGDFSSPSGEALYFDDTKASTLKPYLNANSTSEATDIINFIRGNVVSGFRNRCLPITGASQETGCTAATERVWGLGDIVYSTPTTVANPKEQYDLIYGITSYTSFRQTYNSRRNVVYVGGNDGMLHAFNAGVYQSGDDPNTTNDVEHGWFVANPATGNGWTSPTPALGDELWAFIPFDNLPHLKWLTNQTYTHIYYVDLKPKPTDVRIFCDSDTTPNCVTGQDTSHPGGWGTILIVGMRLGGGAINIDLNGDNDTSDQGEDAFRSAYYALDVTDPEKPPKLLWRFSDNNLGFTTTYPAIAHINGSPEKWFMVVGAGPDNEVPPGDRGYDGRSNKMGRIFIVNLLDGTKVKDFGVDNNSFMGDPTVVDGDLDYTTDVIYIGNAVKSGSSWTGGKLYRINTNGDTDPNNWVLSTVFNAGQPILVGASASKDSLNNLWVFFGTGRYWSNSDKTNSDQQAFYGIKDGCWKENSTTNTCNTTYTLSDLLDATSIVVSAEVGSATQVSGSTDACGGSESCSFTTLISNARTKQGWFVNLSNTGNEPSERVLSKSVVLGGIVIFTTFAPDNDICGFQGDSKVYALYYETGTAYIRSVIGTETIDNNEIIMKSKSIGKGVPTTTGIAIGKKTKGFIQTSTGTIVEVEAEPGLSIRSGPAGWREKTGGGGTSDIDVIYRHITK